MRPPTLPIASLREGMMIDLEPIADWCVPCIAGCLECTTTRDMMQFEFATVDADPIIETDECILLHTSLGSFGLPPDLLVGVIYEDEAA